MFKYIVKRILLAIIILLGVSIVLYILVRCMPTDYVDNKYQSQIAQGTITEEQLQNIKRLYGIDRNDFWGIIGGYFKWLVNCLKGDLGYSFSGKKPVTEVIGSCMWTSFLIAFIALIFEFLIAIPLGVTAATHQYGTRDYIITVLTMIGISLPSFFFAALLIKIFGDGGLGWFPSGGQANAGSTGGNAFTDFFVNLQYYVLPIIALVGISVGSLMRYTRTNTLEVLNADYIRTARAKGLRESKVIYKHAFRNTLIPLVTLLAGILPSLFSGAMIIEETFAIDGIGRVAYKAMNNGDIPLIMGYNMFLAVLSVLGTLLSDIMYVVVDPRVKLK